MSDKKSNYKKITIIAVIILALVCVVGTVIFANSIETTKVAEQMEENTQQAALEDEANASSNEGENTHNNEQQASVTTDNNSAVETFTTTTTESTSDATIAVTQAIKTVDTEDVELNWYQMERPEVEKFDITVIKPNLQINLKATKDVVDFNEEVEYKITIANQGNVDANKIIVSNIIPEGTTFSSASDDGKYNEQTKQIVWKVDVKQNVTKTLTATVVNGKKDGVIVDKAVVDGETTNTVEVRVQDMTAPKIKLNGAKKITLEAGVDKYTEYGATVTDNIDPTINNLQPSAIHYRVNDRIIENVDKVDETKLGTYKLVYEYTDAAGNKAVDIDREDHEYVIREVTVQDTIAPVATNLEIMNIDQVTPGYAKVGDRIRVLVTFEEKLGTDPVICINGVNAENVHIHDSDETRNMYQYMGEVVMTDAMEEGLITFTVSGYKDLAGNEGVPLTNKQINSGETTEIILDKTAPEMKQLSMANEQKVTLGYAKVGDSIWVYALFNEKLSAEPEVTINGVPATKQYDYVDDTQQQYVGAVTMTEEMPEGEIEFTVKGYKDLAGNEGKELTQKDITEGEHIILDKTAPEKKQLSMANEQSVTLGYAKAGDSIWVYALFNEKLSVEPEVTINNVLATKKYDYVDETQQQYVCAATMTKEMPEGEIEFTVKGYKDLAGNVGKDLTQKDITEGDGIILDYTAPTITSPRHSELQVFDKNPYKVVITNRDGETTAKADKEGRTTYWVRLKDGSYTVTATDAAGNVSTEKFTFDITAPNLKVDTINENGYSNSKDPQVHATDKSPFTITVTKNGNDVKRTAIAEKKENGSYSCWFGIGYLGDGDYTVTATDEVGNTKTIKFTLDRVAPSISFDNIVDGVIKQGTSTNIEDKNPFGSVLTSEDGTVKNSRTYRDDRTADGNYWDRFNIKWLGEGTFTITATDAAGNVSKETFRVDATAPVAKWVEIKSINPYTPGFAKAGDKVWVLVTFEEKLGTKPVITINGVKADNVKIHNHAEGSNSYQYMGEVVMTDDMEEGEVKFTINGYKDSVGNEGKELTNDNINYGDPTKIILDHTNPTITFDNIVDGVIKQGTSMNVEDKNPFSSVVTSEDGKKSPTRGCQKDLNADGNHWDRFNIGWLGEGKFTITVTDVAGNVTTKTFTVDATAPTAEMVEIKNIAKKERNSLVPEDTDYAKAGDKIWVYVQFSEHLSVEPTIKINGEVAKIVQTEDGSKFGKNWYKYVGEVVMTKQMNEGEIKFTVSGYKDLVGNEGEQLDNDDITKGFKKIILDYTAPTITDAGPKQVRVYDANPYKFVRKKAGNTTDVSNERVGDNTLSLSSGDGIYTITVTDAAGNVVTETKQVEMENPGAEAVEIKTKEIKDKFDTVPKNIGYAKAGDTICVYVEFSERLSVEPTITINDKKAEKVTTEDGLNYVGEVVMTKKMNQGEIKFTVDGYKDLAGKDGEKLDNDNTKNIRQGFEKIILDYTAPTITNGGDSSHLYIKDANPYKFFRISTKGVTRDYTRKGEVQLTDTISEDGLYTITVTDAAGNVTKRAFIKNSGKSLLISDVEDSTLICPTPEGTNNSTKMNMADEVSSNLPENVQEAVEREATNGRVTALATDPDEMTPRVTEQDEETAEENSGKVTSEEENSAEEQLSNIEENDN